MTSTTIDPNPGNNSASVNTTIVEPTDVAVAITGPATITAGANVTYTLSLANKGPVDAFNVVLSDALPAGETLTAEAQVSGTDFFIDTSAGNTVSFNTDTMPDGNTDVFEVVAVCASNLLNGSVLTNTANVAADNPNPNPGDQTSSVTSTVVNAADLAVTKSGPAGIIAGSSATYTLTLTNNGPSNAQNVNLTDALPIGLILTAETQVSGPDAFTSTPFGNTAGFSAASVSSGDSDVFEVIVDAASSLVQGTEVTDTATVASATFDPNPTNNSATFNSTVGTDADLTLAAAGPPAVTAGTNITYTVSLTNHGPSDAVSVALTDALPAGLTPVSEAQIGGADRFDGTISGTTFGFFAATMTSEDTDVFQMVASVASSVALDTTLNNTASATTVTTDPDPGDGAATVTTDVTTAADLAVTARGSATAAAGTNVTYTISVTDNGPSDAQTVSVTDSLPAGLTLSSEAQLSGPDAFSNTSSGNSASFSAATMASGDTDVFRVVSVSASSLSHGTVLTDTATIGSATLDPVPGNNSASVNTTVSASSGLTIGTKGPASTTAGTNITYTISLTNGGPSDAQNVSLTDALPAGLVLRSESQLSGADTFTNVSTGNTASFTGSSMASGNTDVFAIVATVGSSVAGGRVVVDLATVTSGSAGFGTNTSSANTTVSTSADLSVSESGPTSAIVGTNVTYTITLTNDGPSDAQNVTLTDRLPSGLTLTSAQHVSGKEFFTIASGTSIGFTAAGVSAGDSDVFQISAAVATSLVDGSSITDTATVSTGTSDPNLSNNSSTLTTKILGPQRTLVASAGGPSTIVFVIGADGKLYQHADASGWTAIGAAGTVEAISAVTQTNGSVVLFAEGTDHSLSLYIVGLGWQGVIGGRGSIEAVSAGLDHTGQADVFVIDNSGNLDEWSTSAGWRNAGIGPAGGPVQLSAADDDQAYVVTTNQSVYGNNPTAGWFPLTSPGFARSISASDDGLGNVSLYAVTMGGALFEHANTTGWTQLGAAGTINTISAGRDSSNHADVFVVTTGGQLTENDTLAGWTVLHPPAPATKLSAMLADSVFAVLSDGSVYGHDDSFGFFPLAGPGFAEI